MFKKQLIFTVFLINFAMFNIVNAERKLNEWRYKEPPSVNGVTLGSSLKDLSKLGKPYKLRKLSPGEENWFRPTEERIYEGLIIGIYTPKKRRPYVWSVQIYDKDWNLYPGIHIGMNLKEVQRILGEPFLIQSKENSGRKMWWNPPFKFDANFMLVFRDKILIKIHFSEDNSI